jgi:hypothetical protein
MEGLGLMHGGKAYKWIEERDSISGSIHYITLIAKRHGMGRFCFPFHTLDQNFI